MVIEELKKLDPATLEISDYNKRYLERMRPDWDFYQEIYSHCLDIVAANLEKPIEEATIVDYGGGHGVLSIMAKERGFGQVIYIDNNKKCVETAGVLTDRLGIGPDVMLEGEATELCKWSRRDEVNIDYLLGMDVIEHIYCLDDFFSSLMKINPRMGMIFTTGSTPYNKKVMKRLRKIMINDEQTYRSLRNEYIRASFPDLTEKEIDYWTENTRGLIYQDISRAIESSSPNILSDPYNTCDPRNGNWTERILPISNYEQLLKQYHHNLTVESGFHNTHRKGLKGRLSRWQNKLIALSHGQHRAPWLILNSVAHER